MYPVPKLSFEELRELGLINESEYRNFVIRARFDELKEQGIKTTIIKEILADEFCLSPESIHGIYYRKREKYRFIN
ncbi:MAG: hypothetical protein LC102_05075 [Ignavibacteriales bacterium]|jgi:hypothetical protein|nr:MAG: hypothetical protein F9K26_07020 [Ignavibacteriaceae bacterium]MBW7873138.1 hypothetical protein [Ignavibacteria bacterium]MCZ2142780.1 hypothetical protein [Ignavibacteriales bacterium]MBV6443874.1 hypothetical protein [Ignavibacteriaceae bacterium]MBZ0196283.1 hypothetical protein [Ignavibacteriaceae bacterium]